MIGVMKQNLHFFARETPLYSLDAARLVSEMRFQDKEIEPDMLLAFAGIQVFWESLRNGGNIRNEKIDTVLGRISTDSYGNAVETPPMAFWRWQNNAVVADEQQAESAP